MKKSGNLITHSAKLEGEHTSNFIPLDFAMTDSSLAVQVLTLVFSTRSPPIENWGTQPRCYSLLQKSASASMTPRFARLLRQHLQPAQDTAGSARGSSAHLMHLRLKRESRTDASTSSSNFVDATATWQFSLKCGLAQGRLQQPVLRRSLSSLENSTCRSNRRWSNLDLTRSTSTDRSRALTVKGATFSTASAGSWENGILGWSLSGYQHLGLSFESRRLISYTLFMTGRDRFADCTTSPTRRKIGSWPLKTRNLWKRTKSPATILASLTKEMRLETNVRVILMAVEVMPTRISFALRLNKCTLIRCHYIASGKNLDVLRERHKRYAVVRRCGCHGKTMWGRRRKARSSTRRALS